MLNHYVGKLKFAFSYIFQKIYINLIEINKDLIEINKDSIEINKD